MRRYIVPAMGSKQRSTSLPPPFLKRIWLPNADGQDAPDWASYPFSLPLIRGLDLQFDKPVTILVGDNGTGKSTLLEALAHHAGFSDAGGAQGMRAVGHGRASASDAGSLGAKLRGSWLPQVKQGWFFRAETFFSVARYLDEAAMDAGEAGPNYLAASHGEGFVDFFEERMSRQGIYILDEPEAALSPQKQFEFLKLLRRIQYANNAQVIMATHSPILMALPDAALWQMEQFGMRPVALEDTAHFRLYREFALYPHETVEAMIE
ncbi:AAA family ATPase [Sphingobium phenoxybenzoativorans]|uniref:AAA family ATPase n=1 Tax=Sphingobium phenoxybenzoativorans TaxID=1592790 RepID=UPI000B10B9DF|nr:AAA family ATPase [Sphingobium phenoxybenzoativorans]